LQQSAFNQFQKGTDAQQVINMLRAGGMDFYTAFAIALIATITYIMYTNGVEGFQPAHHYPPRIRDFINGNGPQVGGYGKGFQQKNPTAVTAAKNPGSERYRIQNVYNQIPSLSVEGRDWQITAWSAAKHAHHGPDFGLEPTDYGMTQADLNNIAYNGLINHINQGGTPPNANYVQALQRRWKDAAETGEYYGIQRVLGKDCHVVKTPDTRIFISFESETGKSFTGYELTKLQSDRHEKTQIIGKNWKN
jgi:hypothetical protein